MKESGERGGAAPTAPSTVKRPYHRKQVHFRDDPNHHAHRGQHMDQPNALTVCSGHQHPSNPSTLSNFSQSVLRISTLHMLQSAGYDAVQANSMTVLVDCLGRYLTFLAESAKEFAEHSGRSQVTAFDVADGLSSLGIEISDLKEWLSERPSTEFGQEAEEGRGETTSNNAPAPAAGAGAGAAAPAANRPILPSWRGADPGRVMNDAVWNGRPRISENRDVYEWCALPPGFIMPTTEEEQDDYAYPDNSDDELSNRDIVMAEDVTESQPRRSNWVPESRPPHIPSYMPPFPGVALSTDELEEDEEDQSGKPEIEYSAEPNESILSPATAASTAGLDSAVSRTAASGDGVVPPNLSKLSINTTAPIQPDARELTAAPDANPLGINQSNANVNPYTKVDSPRPLSSLHVAISTSSPSRTGFMLPGQASSKSTSLSSDAENVFSDTLVTILDPTPYFPGMSRRNKGEWRLANAAARPVDLSDTLFSASQDSVIIDGLLKQSAPPALLNKFANPGVSVQDALSPILPSDKSMNGGFSEYHSTQVESLPQVGARTSVLPGSSRKGSFSSSPLSTVTYPVAPAATGSSVGAPAAGTLGKQKAGSRKSSLTGATPAAQSTPVPIYVPPGSQSAAAAAGFSSPIPSAAPINPSILSRIGSNFDPAALLAAATPSNSPPPAPQSLATANGVTTNASVATPVPPLKPVPSAAPVRTSPVGTSPVGTSTTSAPLISNLTTITAAPVVSGTSAPIKLTPTPAATVTKPVPGPISLSALPLSMPANTSRTPIAPTPPTPSTPAAPKIRFKFSALDAISTGDSHEGSSSSKRDHGSSGSHHHHSHHRSSSTTSTGSSHHKKSKRSSRDHDDEDEESDGGHVREKKKKKKSKSKDRDRDRDRDHERDRDRDRDRDRERDRDRDRESDGGGGGSSRHKHKHHKHHRHDSATSNGGSYASPSSGSSHSKSSKAYGYAGTAPPIGSHVSKHGNVVLDEAVEVINCICANPTLDDGLFMIACDSCEEWFHGRCVGIREGDAVTTWFCQRCTAKGRGG
ncbi:hypothetical protein BGZ68_004923 [Mortierella alpina]|nr:hypothetical protein BGZ68_004923 [Mortierella alpina]